MYKSSLLFTVLLSALLTGTLQAKPLEPLKGRFSLGFSDSSGNTDESKANFAFVLGQKKTEELKLHYSGLALYGKTDGIKNTDKRQLGFLSEFIKSNKRSLYASLGYMEDEFAGYDRQTKIGIGLIRYIINQEDKDLSFSLGYDFTQERYTDNTDSDKRWVKFGVKGKRKVNENVFFTCSSEASAPNHKWNEAYRTSTTLGLSFTITPQLETEMKYLYDYNRKPVDSKDKRDTIFITSVSYKI